MKRGVWAIKFVLMAVVFVGLLGYVTQQLWNWLIPQLFAGPVLTFWQTLGLLLLSKIFFWSFSKGGHRSHKPGWGYYWSQKWKGMSPEERERLKQKMKEKWCYGDNYGKERESTVGNSDSSAS